jgi:thiol:disulfide interchange protein
MKEVVLVLGVILAVVGRFLGAFGLLVSLVGLGLILVGCYRWTREKDRHWVFMFWGLLAPVGLLGIALLRNKTWDNHLRDKPRENTPVGSPETGPNTRVVMPTLSPVKENLASTEEVAAQAQAKTMLKPNATVEEAELTRVYGILDRSDDPESSVLASQLSGLLWRLRNGSGRG